MNGYTRTVLTVIAGCLLVLVGGQIDFPPKAHAVSTSSIGGGISQEGPLLRMMGWFIS